MTTANLNNQPNVNNSSVVLAAKPSDMGIRKTMSSLEIAEEVGKPHNDLLKSIRKMELAWIKVNGGNFSLVEYIDSKGESRPYYQFNYEEFMYIISKFDDERRAKLVMRWGKIETGQEAPMYKMVQQEVKTEHSIEDKMKAIELSCKMMRSNKATKARMINSVIAPMGLPTFDYIESKGQKRAAKDLLPNGISSIKFNKALEKLGMIEYMERTSRSKGIEKYPVITGKGLRFGENEESPEHPGKTQPRWYVDKFSELMKLAGLTSESPLFNEN